MRGPLGSVISMESDRALLEGHCLERMGNVAAAATLYKVTPPLASLLRSSSFPKGFRGASLPGSAWGTFASDSARPSDVICLYARNVCKRTQMTGQ